MVEVKGAEESIVLGVELSKPSVLVGTVRGPCHPTRTVWALRSSPPQCPPAT